MCPSTLILLPTKLPTPLPHLCTTNKSPIENKKRPSAHHSYTSNQLKEICNHINSTNLTSLPFRTIRTIHKLRLNNIMRKNRNRKRAQNRINIQNLRQRATTDENCDEIVKHIRLSTFNAR